MLDTSQLVEYQRCPRFYQYRYKLGLYFPPMYAEGDFSKYLVHDPITGWYRAGGREDYVPDWDGLWKKYTDAVPNPPQWLTLGLAKEVYQKYIHKFEFVFEKYEVVAVETMMMTTIPDFGVKPDVVLRRREDGTVWPLDIKVSKHEQTTVEFNRQFVAQVDATGGVGFIKDFYQLGGKGDWVREEHRVAKDYVKEWHDEIRLGVIAMELSEQMQLYPKHAPQSCQMGRVMCPAVAVCQAGKLRSGIIAGWPKVDDPEEYQK